MDKKLCNRGIARAITVLGDVRLLSRNKYMYFELKTLQRNKKGHFLNRK